MVEANQTQTDHNLSIKHEKMTFYTPGCDLVTSQFKGCPKKYHKLNKGFPLSQTPKLWGKKTIEMEVAADPARVWDDFRLSLGATQSEIREANGLPVTCYLILLLYFCCCCFLFPTCDLFITSSIHQSSVNINDRCSTVGWSRLSSWMV